MMMDSDVAADSGNRDARARIMAAASESFQRDGFRRSSMDAIAKAARMSKRTLYACFADKHAVLEAVLSDFITRRFDAIARLSVQSASSRDALITIGHGLTQASGDEVTRSMYRVLIAEADHLPALLDRANRMGVDQVRELVRGPLNDLGVADDATAARILYDLLVLAPIHRAMMNMPYDMIDADRIVVLIVKGMSRDDK